MRQFLEEGMAAVLTLVYSDDAIFVASALFLFIVLVGAANRAAMPPHFWPSARHTAIAWTIWAAYWFKTQFFGLWRGPWYFPTIDETAILLATMCAFYVVISLLVIICRFFWEPSIPLFRTRAYPTLIMSIVIPLLIGAYFSARDYIPYFLASPEERANFMMILAPIPPSYVAYGALVLFVVAAFPHSDPIPLAEVGASILAFFKKVATGEGSPGESTPARDLSSASSVQPHPSSEPLSAPPRPGSSFTASEVPPSATSDVPLQLKLRRSQHAGRWGKIIFSLDARIALTAEHQDLIYKYGLGDIIVYDSDDRKRHAEATQAHLEMSREGPSVFDTPGKQVLGAMSTFWRLSRASVSAARTALSLRITINSLIAGVHIECKDLDELMGAEAAIVEACQIVKGYLQTATTFDGREEIIGF